MIALLGTELLVGERAIELCWMASCDMEEGAGVGDAFVYVASRAPR